MSTLARRLIICCLGVLAGIAAWPVAEVILMYQRIFPSYLIFSIVLGAAFGFILGAFFGSFAGITSSVKPRIGSGAITGALVGLVGGAAGFFIGQGVLFLAGELLFSSYKSFNRIGLPVARAIGWGFLGIFVGMTEGIRAGSLKKIQVGILGGFIGGIPGGFALEYSRLLFPEIIYARLAGFIILGLLIGFFYSLVEKRLAYGVLRVLNGCFKGKEFLIAQKKLKIGKSAKNEISLADYAEVADVHAVLLIKGHDLLLKPADPKFPVHVNEDKITEHPLKYEDVIKIGSARLYYKLE